MPFICPRRVAALPIISLLGLSACGTESAPMGTGSESDETSASDASSGSDGEGSTAESTSASESTGDGDGDGETTTGDGDGDATTGDGDGDGDTYEEVNVYLSGHSLFNLEMPRYLAQVAEAHGKTHRYNLQMGIGSNMSWRLSGEGSEQDRDGNAMTYYVGDEIAQANTIEAPSYDALMVTEAVDVFDHLQWSDSIGNLGVYYDFLVDVAPEARVFFYDSWDSVETGGGSYSSWVAHTRSEYPIWHCIIVAANDDPERATNPIAPIPGGVLLADIVELAESGGIAGLGGADFFSEDGHHLSALGNYVVALGLFVLVRRRVLHRQPS